MKFVHDTIKHKYIVTSDHWGHSVRKWDNGPGHKLDMNDQQLGNFLSLLKRNGWYESTSGKKTPSRTG